MLKQKPEYFQVNEVMKLKLGRGRHSIFLLKKRNYNTLSAIRLVARKLNVEERNIGYAGNKDKKAVTSQYISVLNGGKRGFDYDGVELEYVGQNGRISLGDLEGNKFKIKVKCKRCDFFVNYYGEQRFGKNNWKIGKKILKGKDVFETDKKKLRFYLHSYQSYLFNEVLKKYLAKFESFERKGYVFLKKKIRNVKIPLVNFDTSLKGEIGKLYKEILKKEKVKLEDFLIRRHPYLVSDTVYRDLIVKVKNFKCKDGWVEFFLPKGAYATVFLAKIL